MQFDKPGRGRAVRMRLLGWSAFALAGSLLGSGCGMGGGGGGGGGGGPVAVQILTTSLPPAGQSVPYTTILQASGGMGPYAWALSGGSSLPAGLTLGSGGTITGSASTLGSYVFSVTVTDASTTPETDSASYSLDVSAFSAALALLHWGDAWTGESYPLGSVGGSNTTFTLVSNPSGASITNANPSLGTATFTTGIGTGSDTIRATSSGGPTLDIVVAVLPNPVGKMTARFSSTDVWYLRFDGKHDSSHAFASDFDASLAAIGFRSATSVDATGTTADQLARAYVRQQTIRYCSANYLNNEDGSAAASGLDISFPYDEPTAPHFAPADGAVNNPAANQFNVMSFISGSTSGVIGTAYLDSTSNVSQENNTTTGSAGELGVFIDEISYYFNSGYGNSQLPGSPVGASDVAALKALFYGTSSPGGRYAEIKRIGEGYGRTLAAVAAHEIGHSLGLNHTSPAQSGSIMNASAVISPNASYAFVSADVTILSNDLPGPGRGGSPQTAAEHWAGPDEGYEGAECVVCGSCETRSR